MNESYGENGEQKLTEHISSIPEFREGLLPLQVNICIERSFVECYGLEKAGAGDAAGSFPT